MLTYFLARSLAGPLVALVAAGLFATSGAHIVVGHIAWTNCTTPFFVTATMLSLVGSVVRSSNGLLLLSGILFGLALQTHPSVIFLAPAFVLYYLFAPRIAKDRNAGGRRNGTERRSATPSSSNTRETVGRKGAQIPDLRTQELATGSQEAVLKTEGLMPRTKTPLLTVWPYLAILAALAAYGNVIAYNSQNPEAWLAATARTDYAYVYTPTIDSYLVNLQNLATSLLRAASSSFEGDPNLAAQLALPINIPYLCLLLLGILCGFYLRLWLLLSALAWPMFLMPYFNKDYSFPIAVRYLGYLLPLLSILMALPVALMIKRFWRRTRPLVVVPAVFYIVLALLPLANLNGYYSRYLGENATSPTIMALQTEIRARYQAKIVSKVVLDPQLDWLFTAPGGRVLKAFDLLLETERIPYRTVAITPDNIRYEMQGIDKPIVLIASPASRQRLGDAFRIVPIEVPSRPYLNRDGYWAYVVHVPKP